MQLDEDSTRCVYAPATHCDASFVERCEGTRCVSCDEALGWVQAVDCVKLGSTGCHVDAAPGTAVCDSQRISTPAPPSAPTLVTLLLARA